MPPKGNRVSKRGQKGKSPGSKAKSSKPKATTNPSTPAPAPAPAPLSSDPNGPIYFWRPQEAATGYLSQWYASQPFRDRAGDGDGGGNGKVYATAEHYMMHHKALLFGDADAAAAVLEAASPRAVRALGRGVRGFDDAVWARERERIVVEGNWCKFSLPISSSSSSSSATEEKGKGEGEEEEGEQSVRTWRLGDGEAAGEARAASFRDVLLATGDRELVEASPYDRVWGVGFAAAGAAANRRQKWGMNLLGKCLMEVRDRFRKEDEAAALERGEGELPQAE
ncbi:putative duf1768-domain-containing protein [Rosellinia necatrix]|uniref:Putative duf1768-domain-containing protein n=1 Tax=Rosellinia necatrix TaxID=77044 RepID=A0A1S7UI37_ROSNE|nr:putative duf1768-domain-containing protein [Rosellinia necatrix]